MPLWIVKQRRHGQGNPLEPAALELPLDAQAPVLDLHFHDDGAVRDAEPLGKHDPDLGVPLVVGLQARQHQVECLLAHGIGERCGHAERIGRCQVRVLDVNGAIGAAGERLANHRRRARRPGRAHHDLSPVLLLEPQPLLEGVRVGLVHFEAGVGFPDPRLRVVQARLPLARRDLLDTDGDLHVLLWRRTVPGSVPGGFQVPGGSRSSGCLVPGSKFVVPTPSHPIHRPAPASGPRRSTGCPNPELNLERFGTRLFTLTNLLVIS